MRYALSLFLLAHAPVPATAACTDDNAALLGFDGFAAAMSGAPPGFQFYYPGYWDYGLGGPGDPLAQDADENGIPDHFDFAFLARAMCADPAVDAHYHAALAYQQAIWVVGGVDYSYGGINGIAALDTMSSGAAPLIAWTSGSGYGPYTDGGEPLAGEGDFDGDGYSNLDEYESVAAANGDPAAYAEAAVNPGLAGNVPIAPPGAPAGAAALWAIMAAALTAAGLRRL